MTRLLTCLLAAGALAFAAGSAQAEIRRDAVINGVRLAYWAARPVAATDVPVLYLHGGPGYNSYSFRKTAGARLAGRHPMLYLDQRGSGESERPWAGDYAMPTLVNDVEGLRRHLGVERMVVMGHSFGATVAVEYARAHPERVAKLVLIGAAVDVPEAMATWVESLRQAHPDAYAATLEEPEGVRLQSLAAGDACARSRASMAFVDAALAKVPDRQAFRDLQQFHNREALLEQQRLDAESGLRNTGEIGATVFAPDSSFPCYRVPEPGSLSMPVLLVVGRHDKAVGVRPQRDLAGRLPRATLVELAGSAHFPYAEEPAAFDAAVHAFLADGGARR